MFAVKDKRSGKFLKNFSGSLNRFEFHVSYAACDEYGNGRKKTGKELHDLMWCLDSPNGAKLFKTKQGISTAFYSYRRNNISLSKVLPWLEIVPVEVMIAVVKTEEKPKEKKRSYVEEF